MDNIDRLLIALWLVAVAFLTPWIIAVINEPRVLAALFFPLNF